MKTVKNWRPKTMETATNSLQGRAAAVDRPSRTRSAMTNRPLHKRANGNSAIGRRVRDLYRAFMARLGNPADPISQARVLNAAELTVALEQQRLAAARGEPVDLTQLVKLSNLVARTLRALGLTIKVEKPRGGDGGLTLARARWEEQREQEKARKAATEVREATTAKDTEVPPDGRAA
jgi:hypothetical protein